MINTLTWGFHHSNFSEIIVNLEQNNIIKNKVWIGKNKKLCSHSINDFHEFKSEDFSFSNNKIYLEILEELEKENEIIFDMLSRTVESINKDYSELKNIYLFYVKYFIHLLETNDIKLILFIYIPHLSVEYILYKVAKKLNIRTIMLNQTLFSNRFFIVEDLDDFGNFQQISNQCCEEEFKIDNCFEKDLFYMEKKHFKDISCLKNNYKILKKSLSPFNRQKINFFEVISKIIKCNKFNKLSKKYEINNPDFNENYVYFPLHLQPELTTSPLGGRYSDQLLAIEKLLELLPPNWKVYVKENPKQLEYKRGEYFYKRLKALNNVVLVSKNINTYRLLKDCKFVATITGTVGWEAISGGKNVLIFGKAWYRSLNGVFEYKNNINLDTILDYKIDHHSLQEKFNLLMKKTRKGIVESVYSNLVKDYDDQKNIKFIQDALESQIIEGSLNV